MMGDFTHPHFAEPRWLWLAVLAPLGVLALHRYAAWQRGRQWARFAPAAGAGALAAAHRRGRRWLKEALLLLAAAAVGLALARPQWGETADTTRALGEDLMFVLDCSRSMLATDVAPDRLGRAKFAILDYVQRQAGGRVGLVAFAGDAFLQCPLSFDYDAFREALLAVDEHTIPVGGTDLGRALDEAALGLEKNARRKSIILLTDGEDLENAGVTKAKALAEKGVVVYAIGVGTAAGSILRVTNEQGFPETVRDPAGQEVRSRLDEPTLAAIAQATHGSYHPLGAVGEGLAAVRRQIAVGGEGAGAARERKSGVERFHVPVAALVVLLVVESLVGTRRKVRQIEAPAT